jgi:hypothetical protein
MGDLLVENPEAYSRVCESEYRAGDKAALMRIIVFSALNKSPIPEWASEVLDGAYGYAVWDEIASWDEVFGKPSRKRGHVIRKWYRRHEVWARIDELSAQGRAKDDLLFAEVGEELQIGGKTEVKRLYAAVRKEYAAWGPKPKRVRHRTEKE